MTTTHGAPKETELSDDSADRAERIKSVSEFGLTKFLDPLRIPPVIKVPAHHNPQRIKIPMRTKTVKLHSQLPPSQVWTYDGSFPGPTIDVRRGQKLRVAWQNELTGSYPVIGVEAKPEGDPLLTPDPGRDGEEPLPKVAALPPWTVVHLHGQQTGGGNDGWTENAVLPGDAQLAEYPNDQRATTLWYHDHAMAITSLNVMAGLVGMYLIRDAEEDALHLPCGDHEVPLILCDRNFDTEADGTLTGKLLHKVNIAPGLPEKALLPFVGPFTLVNGVIWPYLKVEPRWMRFRVLNASNARFYRLELHDENGAPVSKAMQLIGTDGGLLGAPVPLDRVTLAPAERADVLIDFSAFRGKSLTLVNMPNEQGELGTPIQSDVMQFRVRSAHAHDNFKLPSKLSPSFARIDHDAVQHEHRWLVLTLPNGIHPEMWEMIEIEDPPATFPTDGIVQIQLRPDGPVKTLKRVGRTFKDAANFYVKQNHWEMWKILNLNVDPLVTHPIHLHLIQFQALSRQHFNVAGSDAIVGGTTVPVTYKEEGKLDASEQGWKDVIRVAGGELVTILGQFAGASGRFMYHCHILEHEDEGMMSTFVVMPEEIHAIEPPGHGHDHHD